jgi:hypothetical protein
VSVKICRDCRSDWEKLPEPKGPVEYRPRPIVEGSGGRCATHWRAEKARRKAASHEKRVQKVYGLAPGDYDRLYAAQGGKCAICRRATGARKKLAVDHDHATGLVRMLACGPCNKIIGHFRDDPNLLRTAAWVLENPPAGYLNIQAIHEENR